MRENPNELQVFEKFIPILKGMNKENYVSIVNEHLVPIFTEGGVPVAEGVLVLNLGAAIVEDQEVWLNASRLLLPSLSEAWRDALKAYAQAASVVPVPEVFKGMPTFGVNDVIKRTVASVEAMTRFEAEENEYEPLTPEEREELRVVTNSQFRVKGLLTERYGGLYLLEAVDNGEDYELPIATTDRDFEKAKP